MRYGFTDNGFVVVDDSKQVGEFAYRTSPHWQRACRNPEKVAAEMLSKTWKECPSHIRERHYLNLCECINHATRWPKVIG